MRSTLRPPARNLASVLALIGASWLPAARGWAMVYRGYLVRRVAGKRREAGR